MNLLHYSTERKTVRLLHFWADQGLSEQNERNQAELFGRADLFIDGIEMLCPNHTEGQQRLIVEAVNCVKRAAMLCHGTYVTDAKSLNEVSQP